jgi:hypothetical protein
MTRPKLVALMASEISGFAIAPREINKRPAEQTISAYPRIRGFVSVRRGGEPISATPVTSLWQTGRRQLRASQLARRHLRLGRLSYRVGGRPPAGEAYRSGGAGGSLTSELVNETYGHDASLMIRRVPDYSASAADEEFR